MATKKSRKSTALDDQREENRLLSNKYADLLGENSNLHRHQVSLESRCMTQQTSMAKLVGDKEERDKHIALQNERIQLLERDVEILRKGLANSSRTIIDLID